MERNIKKIGLVNLVLLLAVGAASAFLARYSNSLAAQAGLVFLGLGFLVIAIGYFQMRLEETERLEKLEFDELNKAASASSLFQSADAEVFPARRSREQFERFIVPAFTVILFLLQAGGVYWFSRWLSTIIPTPIQQPAVGMSLFGLFALTLFLLGKYSVGLTRLEGARLLRPGANYLLLTAYVCFLITGSIAAVELGFPKVDIVLAFVLVGVLGLIAAETLINLILEIYRPRVKGKVGRVLYDSRLVGLLAEPEGLFTTAAQALDYQFGFKVSETWFYRFLENALVWLILLQLGVLLLSTSFVFISPGEQGLKERLGRPLGESGVLEPGLHVKMPWPIDKVYRFQTRMIQSFAVGFVPDEDDAHERAVVWTGKHYKEESNWIISSPQQGSGSINTANNERGVPADLINVSIPVQFQIKDLRAWAYNHTDASNLLQKVSTREVVRYLAATDLFRLLSTGRSEAANELRTRIQKQADDLQLGVNIVLVGLQDLHPPTKVAGSFEEVISTMQENEAKVYEAKGYALRSLSLAKADSEKRINDAHSYSNRVVEGAAAQAAQFTNQVHAYQASPKVFLERAYLQTLERGATNARKYVLLTTNKQDILQMNLEEKIRGDLINDLSIPSSKR